MAGRVVTGAVFVTRAVFVMVEAGLAVEGGKGLGIQRFHGRALAHHALVQTQHPLRVAVYDAKIVRDQQQSCSTLHLDAMKERVDRLLKAGVNCRSGFVEEKDAGFLKQRGSDEHTLRFAAR